MVFSIGNVVVVYAVWCYVVCGICGMVVWWCVLFGGMWYMWYVVVFSMLHLVCGI